MGSSGWAPSGGALGQASRTGCVFDPIEAPCVLLDSMDSIDSRDSTDSIDASQLAFVMDLTFIYNKRCARQQPVL